MAAEFLERGALLDDTMANGDEDASVMVLFGLVCVIG